MAEEILEKREHFALGKGLASLIPKDKISAIEDSAIGEKVLQINVDKILPNPYQPRKDFDKEGLQELADSIKIHGILEPLLATKKEGGIYELVAGERRLRAAKIAKLENVPIIIKKATDRQKMSWALVENLQRENLNSIDEALAYKYLQDEYSLTPSEISRGGFSRKSPQAVGNIIRLLKLPEIIKNGVREGKIQGTHARTLLGLKREDQQLAMYQLILRGNLTKSDVEKRVQIINKKFKGESFRENNARTPEIIEKEEELCEYFGRSVHINRKKNGAGEITISFRTMDEMNEAIKRIFK